MTLSLCLCDKEYFAANYWPITELILRSLHKLKLVGLDLVQILLEVYLADASLHSNLTEHLQLLNLNLFPPKKLILSQPEAFEPIVEIIVTVAKVNLDFAFKTIIFELLRGDTVIPE